MYGGGHVGLMGAVADSVLDAGGEAVGVIPQQLVDRELGTRGLTELQVVASMHERKALMAELRDAFVALPGGFGTLDELVEIITWRQLGTPRQADRAARRRRLLVPFAVLVEHLRTAGFLRVDPGEILRDDDADRLVRRVA